MTGELLVGVVIGVGIGEYYRRVVDRIRREQITDLREDAQPVPVSRRSARREPTQEELEWVEAFDEIQRPAKRRATPVISDEQYAQMKASGRTAGKIKGGETN